MRDRELCVEIVDDELVIRIGIDTLATSAIMGPYFTTLMESNGDQPDTVVISDNRTFAESIINALKDESEDGTNRMHIMFDSAAEYVSEQGLDGLEFSGG